jgi:cytidine deaminase
MTGDGPELFFGLVGAVGTDLGVVTEALQDSLTAVGYNAEPVIHLVRLLCELSPYRALPSREAPRDDYLMRHMDAGDNFRERIGRHDALAALGIAEIMQQRKDAGAVGGDALPRRAYIIRSLKRPEEVQTLRKVYGTSFFLIAAYAPYEIRRAKLAKDIATTNSEYPVSSAHYSKAELLIARDQEEPGLSHGQKLRDTFHRADLFLDLSDNAGAKKATQRFVELIFDHPSHTPTREEYGMFHAWASALRSAELGRQVGAAISSAEGDIITVGTNEVPKAGGGLYWCDDIPDRREYVSGVDSNDEHKRILITDTLRLLQKAGWLSSEKNKLPPTELASLAMSGAAPAIPERALIRRLIEFGRAVHAEMAAIVDAARRGVSVARCTMHVTTFPCHLCARHIVAAGIMEVRYIEPYAKSLTEDLYPDSIVVDSHMSRSDQVIFRPFEGIAPRQYMHLFSEKARKSNSGEIRKFVPYTAMPRWSESKRAYREREEDMAATIKSDMKNRGMHAGFANL